MWGEGPIESNFEQIEIEPTEEDLVQIRSNLYNIFIIVGALEFKLNDRGEEDTNKKEMKDIIKKIKKGTNSQEELADLLTKLIK